MCRQGTIRWYCGCRRENDPRGSSCRHQTLTERKEECESLRIPPERWGIPRFATRETWGNHCLASKSGYIDWVSHCRAANDRGGRFEDTCPPSQRRPDINMHAFDPHYICDHCQIEGTVPEAAPRRRIPVFDQGQEDLLRYNWDLIVRHWP